MGSQHASLIDGSNKGSENPIYENWQQCQSHDPAICPVALCTFLAAVEASTQFIDLPFG